MDISYTAVEERLTNAIVAYNACKKPKMSEIARQFYVPYDRLRSRLNNASFKLAIRGLYNRRLKLDQELALSLYC